MTLANLQKPRMQLNLFQSNLIIINKKGKNANWEFNNLAELKSHYRKLEDTQLKWRGKNTES